MNINSLIKDNNILVSFDKYKITIKSEKLLKSKKIHILLFSLSLHNVHLLPNKDQIYCGFFPSLFLGGLFSSQAICFNLPDFLYFSLACKCIIWKFVFCSIRIKNILHLQITLKNLKEVYFLEQNSPNKSTTYIGNVMEIRNFKPDYIS